VAGHIASGRDRRMGAVQAARDAGAEPDAEKRAAGAAAQGKTADSLPQAADYTVDRLRDDYLGGCIELA